MRLVLAILATVGLFAAVGAIVAWIYFVHHVSNGELWGLALALSPAFVAIGAAIYRALPSKESQE